MAAYGLNEFVEEGVIALGQTPSTQIGGGYVEPQSENGSPLRILFLSSDSISATKMFVANKAKEFAKGRLNCHKKNVYAMSNISEDEHLLKSFADTFKAGGDRALAGVLAIAEEAHAIQAAVDVIRDAHFDKHFNVRKGEVSRRIHEANPDIVHFSGHIKKDAGLVFSCRDKSSVMGFINEYMNENSLKECFCKKHIQLAVLLSCNSAEFARFLVETGVARIAIGSDSKVYDDCALRFVENFYGELAKKSSMTNLSFDATVNAAYAFAIKSETMRKCPMHIYPEIKFDKSFTKTIDNKIAVAENSLKNPLTEVKLKNDYV